MTDWTPVEDDLPPEGEIVKTKIDDEMCLRRQVELQILDGQWCDEEGEPIHYVPTHWQPRDDG